jgi:hypothetical protein
VKTPVAAFANPKPVSSGLFVLLPKFRLPWNVPPPPAPTFCALKL